MTDPWDVTRPATAAAPRLDDTPVGGVPIVPPPRTARWGRRITVLLGLLLGALLAYYLISLLQVWSTGRSDQARPVDAIVVMGAAQYDGRPSPQLAARLDHALARYRAGDAPVIVVTGGKRPGDRFTEAQASERYLVERGVPVSAILREDEGRNSYDSLAGVRWILASRGVDRVLLVSDPYHSLRIRLIADELGLEAYVSPTRTSPVHGWLAARREMKEAAGVALGRIVGFDRLLRITG